MQFFVLESKYIYLEVQKNVVGKRKFAEKMQFFVMWESMDLVLNVSSYVCITCLKICIICVIAGHE